MHCKKWKVFTLFHCKKWKVFTPLHCKKWKVFTTIASFEGNIAAPSTTLTGSIHTSKNTGCLRLQPTGFNTLNHDAKVLLTQNPLSVSVTFCHFPSRFGVICHFPTLFVTYCYFPTLFVTFLL